MYVNVKIRLATFAAHLGMSDAQFEKSISMPANTLRRTESSVKAEVLTSAIHAYPQLSPDWLLTGSGPMLRPLREHPSASDDSSFVQNEFSPTALAEPTPAYHGIKSKDITLPVRVYEELLHQLKVKDQQLEDAASQIHTLFEMIKTN